MSKARLGDWRDQRARMIRGIDELTEYIDPLPRERAFFSHPFEGAVDFAVSSYYLSLIGPKPDDPIRRQCIPSDEERRVLPYESRDPLEDEAHSPLPRLVHRYRDRVLLLVTDECAVYCRHCFRRHLVGGKEGAAGRQGRQGRRGALTKKQAGAAADYLAAHPEVKEAILSGGDPLTLSDERIDELLRTLRSKRADLVLRLATRIPAVLPARITGGLVSVLEEHKPLYVISQFNHPAEMSEESRAALALLADAGLPILNQAVLLRGVNDRVEVLEELFHGLTAQRVFPYYLLQGDLAAGTSHFRVPLSRGLELVRKLRRRLSGLAMPVYALDLPGGGGKIPLTENYFVTDYETGFEPGSSAGRDGESPRGFHFRSLDGTVYFYPEEE